MKLLSGLGGVGKTTIAREFAEIVARNSPLELEQVVWLSAKRQFFATLVDKYEPTSRVDFTDLPSLLRAILRELGLPEDQIEPDASREALIEEVIQAVCRRETLDVKAAELMKVQLGQFDRVIQALEAQESPDEALLHEAHLSKVMLESNWNNYRHQFGS